MGGERNEVAEERCILEVFQVARSRYKSRPSVVSLLKRASRNAITRACVCVCVCVSVRARAKCPTPVLMKSDGNVRGTTRTGNCLSLRNFVIGIDARNCPLDHHPVAYDTNFSSALIDLAFDLAFKIVLSTISKCCCMVIPVIEF